MNDFTHCLRLSGIKLFCIERPMSIDCFVVFCSAYCDCCHCIYYIFFKFWLLLSMFLENNILKMY